ncbi:hypothetical protein I305_03729 [Cryptococcus gattii E566]|uniref:Xylanolytic transcriptional activator regulatory domain-containing protein n=2 Tax=Cryptococcus gattii TaxID=37769 RepID=E6R8F4_CRYGW|nr:Hypothetical Protein CGB_F4630C [Cryptococcus gattii WM276]ADV23044.1 Hypothetical Protein CGB_F4630C [Cryptococcus gattii WM276]KIR82517.1 hypothetical protein I306_00351 [Cryptococcus gattii EJB2]KIY33840.1 hypothetical protein I305_03729 [Cryptococcus gattii E566]
MDDDSSSVTRKSAIGPVRVSQRQPQSCTECTRCDKRVPCVNCCKRGVPEKCQIEQVIASKNLSTTAQIRSLRDEMLVADDELAQRIAALEELVKTLTASREASGKATKTARTLSTSVSPLAADDLDHNAKEKNDESTSGGYDDVEAEAAATLEFLAIGRLRPKPPGESDVMDNVDTNQDDGQQACLEDGKMNESPPIILSLFDSTHPSTHPHTYLHLPPVQPSRLNSRRLALYHEVVRKDILSQLPPATVGRALVQFDMDNVAWMHCCYHGPTFQREADLVWAELASDDIEINWSFMALLFGVLMSGAYHLPQGTFQHLFPSQTRLDLINQWFNACIMCLQEADWMRSHSLYAIQCVAIITSAANHVGKADLYFTLLGAAVRIAQALNLHRLGPDSELLYKSKNSKLIIAREVRKRTWYQLLYQGKFCCTPYFWVLISINRAQFNTAPPIHCIDSMLGLGMEEAKVSYDIPTTDSHVCQLYKLALAYSSTENMTPLPYDVILQIDRDIHTIMNEAPLWMRDENYILDPSAPSWADWQRKAYLLSASHKVIVIHRPYLGRAFRGDQRYIRSRENCLQHAHKILRIFKGCPLVQFRTTWTVLVHAVAASLILLLDASQQTNHSALNSIRIVRETVDILHQLSDLSIIAKKGFLVISPLIEDSAQFTEAGSDVSIRSRKAFLGKAETELKQALDVFRRGHTTALPSASLFSGTGNVELPGMGSLDVSMASDLDAMVAASSLTATSQVTGLEATDVWDPFLWNSQGDMGISNNPSMMMDWGNPESLSLSGDTSGMDWMSYTSAENGLIVHE